MPTAETTVDVTFPCWFIEKPALTFGAEVTDSIIEAGAFPTVSAVVVSWTMVHEQRLGGGYYTGCRLALVVSGRDGQRFSINWNAEGKAVRAPFNDGQPT